MCTPRHHTRQLAKLCPPLCTPQCGFPDLALEMLDLGANANITDCNGDTGLHLAIKLKQTRLAHIMVNRGGIKLDVQDKRMQDTALVSVPGSRRHTHT